jgi:hypothetical protein
MQEVTRGMLHGVAQVHHQYMYASCGRIALACGSTAAVVLHMHDVG